MSPEPSLLTPEERDELEGTVLVRHRLEEQYADLEQQHETASLGMWIFLGTEVLLFGVLFLGTNSCSSGMSPWGRLGRPSGRSC